MAKPSWTEERIAVLRKTVADGKSAGELVRAYALTYSAVYSKARKLGLRFDSDRPCAPVQWRSTVSAVTDERRRLASLERDWRLVG
jgi:hypothetical protein